VQQNNERYAHIQSLIHDVNSVAEYTFEVYYTGRYSWATKDISDVALLAPYHIWKPYIAGEDQLLWTMDDNDHRFWDGYDTVDAYGYTAPVIDTPSGPVQLTHLQGNGPFVFPHGGWVPDTSIRLVRWYDPDYETGWHRTRILRGDTDLSGYVDIKGDIFPTVIASGTQPGMANWIPEADTANPVGLIDGRDRAKILDDIGHYWYPP